VCPGRGRAEIHRELKRPGVTLQRLHLEYLQRHPDGYRYSQFCRHYQDWARRLAPTMRQVHRAGEKVFVDFSGKKPVIVDGHTGELVPVDLFVGALGASSYVYAEACPGQDVLSWISAHVRMVEFFGGAPAVFVPEYVARHIFGLLCPPALCGRRAANSRPDTVAAKSKPHNRQRELSHASKDSSLRQTGFGGSAAETPAGGSHTRRAASFARVLISA
jgi:hypothetical protein